MSPSHPIAADHAADRLLNAIARRRTPVCVGLDPVADRLPASMGVGSGAADQAKAVLEFSLGVLDAVAASVPCVKIQSACFERYGAAGVSAMERVIARAREAGLETILDGKRGDIGVSAEHYAAAAFPDPGFKSGADWVTINAYLGRDGIEPFLRPGRGAFALVRTSNPGGDAVQNAPLADGRTVAEMMAAMVATIGETHLGTSGYSALGAVVGATKPAAAATLRRLMPRQIFLVPGYGAQGGGVADILPCFNEDGRGAIVTASRLVIFAFERNDPAWQRAIGDAAANFAEEIGRALGMR